MVVYKYTNKINGKVYIGITTRDIETRHKEHLKKTKRDYVFYRALMKYGVGSFNLEVIDTAETYEELQEKEKHYIKKFRSYVGFRDSNGYNMTFGGEGTLGYSHSEQTRRKLSLQKKILYKHAPHPAKGVPVGEETREKLRVAMTGRYRGKDNPYYGKKHPKEIRTIMSELAKKRIRENGHPMQGKTLSEETKRKISKKLKGRVISEKQRKEHSERIRGHKNPNALKVKCITTGEVFNYMGEASEKYNLDRSNLTKCCKGKTKWCGIHPQTGEKLKWTYV